MITVSGNRDSVQKRFDDYVFYSPDGCWYWTGPMQTSGYGRMWLNSREDGAHRISYKLFRGEVTKGLFVCHSCYNRLCVNPDHLWLGTADDNNKDAKRKFRSAFGSRNGMSKLSEAEVIEMRSTIKRLCKDMALKYNVSIKSVRLIVQGQRWAHL